jgi:hypothetical protein
MTEPPGKKPKVVRSQVFKNRIQATLDAHHHGLDPDDPDNIIVRKNYLVQP